MKSEKEKVFETDGDFFEMMKNIEKEAIKEIEEEENKQKNKKD